jgi:signal transduction histidine kinase/CheY-like chemotaxis protein
MSDSRRPPSIVPAAEDRLAADAVAPDWLGAAEGGEMGRRIRAFDFSRTSLGKLADWPETLQSCARLVLSNRFPMHIWWGPELTYLYNDAHIPLLGRRHPEALGRPAASVWTDAWSIIGPQAEAVMRRGESTYNERAHFELTRNGFPEEAWFTWSYSPIRGKGDSVLGVFCMGVEETAKVLGEKARERLADEQLRQVADRSAHAILESINEAFFKLDREWRFTYLNTQSFVLLGRPPQDLVGKSLWDEYPGLHGSPFEPIYRGVAATRKADSIVQYFPSHQRWYDVRAYPSEDGGLSVYFRDVSSEKRVEEENEKLIASERRARAEADSNLAAKDRFLASLSHELRTPLNPALLLASENASDPQLPERVRRDFDAIRKHIELEVHLIDDILDLTRIAQGKLALTLGPTDLHAVVLESLTIVRADVLEKNLVLSVKLNAERFWISGDAVRLQQVTWNILRNAVKFTPWGGRVSVESRVSEDNTTVEVWITDSGIGLTPEEIGRIFDAFAQGRHAEVGISSQYGGLGLGLTISRTLVELHGGRIRVSSEGKGRGATFVIELPLLPAVPAAEEGAAPMDAASSPPADGEPTVGLRILLVEDHKSSRVILARLLARRGHEVVQASTCSEALRIAAEGQYDLLISDIGLPDGDGYALMCELRERYHMRGVALTGFGMEEDHARSSAAGFLLHLTKPISLRSLEAALAELRRAAQGSG